MNPVEQKSIQRIRTILFDEYLAMAHLGWKMCEKLMLDTYRYFVSECDRLDARERKAAYDHKRYATKKAGEKERTS